MAETSKSASASRGSSDQMKTQGARGAASGGGEMSEGLNELFLAQLKDIYYAEKQILKTIPKMVKAAQSAELKEAFETHREETSGQIERLEQVFQILGQKPKAEQCEAIQGIIAEGQEVMEDFKGKPAIDVGLVGAGKAVEHYEIARYTSMKMLAKHLGMKDAQKLIEQNLAEETKTDQLLDQCGEMIIGKAA
jgi:ferritin-like metal-binding protein YciE